MILVQRLRWIGESATCVCMLFLLSGHCNCTYCTLNFKIVGMRPVQCSQAVARSLELVFSLTVMVGISGEQDGALTHSVAVLWSSTIKAETSSSLHTLGWACAAQTDSRMWASPQGLLGSIFVCVLQGLYFFHPESLNNTKLRSQVHLFPKVPPDCAISVGGFRLRLCLGWLL